MFPSWKLSAQEPLLDEPDGLVSAEERERTRPRSHEFGGALPLGRRRLRRPALLGLAATLALGLGLGLPLLTQTAAASGTSPNIAWGTPTLADSALPYAEPNPIRSMSCFSSLSCVGVTGFGQIISSSNATGNTLGDWSVLPSSLITSDATDYSLNSVSCSGGTCVAAGNSPTYTPAFLTSTNPTGGQAADWTATTVSDQTGYTIVAVQCPASNVCYALDESGNLLAYNGTSWTLQEESASGSTVPPAVNVAAQTHAYQITGLSCPTTSFCVAADNAGNAYISPTLSASDTAAQLATAWTVSATGLSDAYAGVSCTSASDGTVMRADDDKG
ncbi:MAG: hypothetical protein M0T77_11480, partial [Actinomycetota bacterium]|nr:hypothetical protein [Actinomycetota bacterium]